jgi:hypothetical protein
MPAYQLTTTPFEYHIESLFSLQILQKTSSTNIIMQSYQEHVSTGHIPFIEELLRKHLPTVLLTQCFNEEQLPFALEVKSTEIGHLFEHILLEYLCQLKIAKGAQSAVFSGRTSWNWIKDPRGKFHIRLTCGKKDADILPFALEKTINLMKIILGVEQEPLFSTMNPTISKRGLKNGKRHKGK